MRRCGARAIVAMRRWRTPDDSGNACASTLRAEACIGSRTMMIRHHGRMRGWMNTRSPSRLTGTARSVRDVAMVVPPRRRFAAIATCFVLSFAAATAWSEPVKIELRNGDRVTGEILDRNDRVIILKHKQLGRLEIPTVEVTPASLHPGVLGTSILAGWTKELDFGVLGSSGDTDEADLRLSILLDHADEHRHVQLQGVYEVSYSEGEVDENAAHVEGVHDWLWPESHWFAFLYELYDFDKFEAWEHRTTTGAGPGYHLIPDPPFKLDTRFGPFFTYEFGDERTARPEMGGGLFSNWQIRDGHSVTLSDVYFQTLDELKFRNLTVFEWKVRLAMATALSFKLGCRNEYDSASRDSKNNLKYYTALSLDL
jgi:putative salt-induced outer membrane protein YdiY